MDAFTEKLAFVTKALSLSRGRLGAELGVDKSVVSRWFSGARAPTSNNMAAITALITARAPRFTLLDWDRDLDGLAQVLGVEAPGGGTTGLSNTLSFRLPDDIAAASRARAGDYEGLYRLTFSAGVESQPQLFIHAYVLVRRAANGLLSYKVGVFDFVREGWATIVNNQFFGVALDSARGSFSLAVLNGVAGQKARILDGLILTCSGDLGGTPTALACVSERVADLSDDADADDQRYAVLLTQPAMAPEGSIAESISRQLLRDVGPAAAAAGGDLLLIMPALRSLSRA